MSEPLLRFLLLGGVTVLALAIGLAASRWARPSHPPIDLGGLELPPGLVLFTSTDCSTCHRARAVAESTGAPIREVTHELEPDLLARAGVEAVPLTAVIDGTGAVRGLFAGVPRRAALARALASLD